MVFNIGERELAGYFPSAMEFLSCAVEEGMEAQIKDTLGFPAGDLPMKQGKAKKLFLGGN
ncbi:unnamed protein product [Ilex paraguariensis]|uniref:Uncharacterized protein n=1 Tax=Ilex paraguariensis TaxID=185542 RepID=A0ABC8SW14_9AQUA